MKAEQVDQALRQKFVVEGSRLVFWHDQGGEFVDYLAGGLQGDLAMVKVLDVAAVGGLSVKLLLERKDTTGKYLVYSRGEPAPSEEDWLLDIRLYSSEFHADVASLWLQELGLASLSLRDHLKARAVFLGSHDRRRKLARLVSPHDDEAAIDLKMMAVVAGSDLANRFEVLRALYHGHAKGDRFPLGEPPEVLKTLEKMGLLERFWGFMRDEFAYEASEPSAAGLLRALLISELLRQSEGASMPALAHHRLPAAGARNAVVFLTQWRDSNATAASYDAAAAAIAAEQNISAALAPLELDAIKKVSTFWEAEKRVVSRLKEHLLDETQVADVAAIAAVVVERKAGHWLAGPGRDAPERQAIAHAYDAVVAASELFALHTEHRHALSFGDPGALLTAYQKTLYRFDRLYREFCARAKPARGQGWDLLKTLTQRVERVYDQGFLEPLGLAWSQLLDKGFLGKWALEDLPAQQNFYSTYIAPHLADSDRKRAFVIISDAFRYEAAHELTEALNGRYRMTAELSAMLGVLPSYTALGMASLLPRKTLAYNDKGDVLVDGKAVASTDARSKQLASVNGMACTAEELRKHKQDDARAFTDGKRVVYIYHNVVDARGDHAATEGETFEAVCDCIGELVELVQFCVNKLNAAKVWITADHGFLFQEQAPDETDKSKLSYKPDHALKLKKRYVIGPDLGGAPEVHHGAIEVTSGAKGNMEFWTPRGANRFHFAGGARFVHGGAMPQEVIVPLITVSQLRGKEKEASRIEKVSIQVLGSSHKITTPKYRFEIIQTEKVAERRKPLVVRAAVYDGTVPVTSVATVTFDSASDGIDERKKSLQLELQTGPYDKAKPYRLILRDAETEAEVQSIPVVIDRSFDDDF